MAPAEPSQARSGDVSGDAEDEDVLLARHVGREMVTENAPKRQSMRVGLMILVALSGLCTVFVLMVTALVGWQEHVEAQWPEMMARVAICGLEQTDPDGREMYYIHCTLSYAVGGEQNLAAVYSRIVPSRKIWQYPPNQIGPFEDWVAEHPAGTPVAVRYNPHRHTKVVLVETDMPGGGPQTPSNIKQGSLGRIFLGSTDDCGPHAAAIPWKRR